MWRYETREMSDSRRDNVVSGARGNGNGGYGGIVAVVVVVVMVVVVLVVVLIITSTLVTPEKNFRSS